MNIITVIALVFLVLSFIFAIMSREFMSPLLLAVYSLCTVAVLGRVIKS